MAMYRVLVDSNGDAIGGRYAKLRCAALEFSSIQGVANPMGS